MKYIQKTLTEQELLAVKQIEQKLALYCRAMDEKDDALGYSLFTEDSNLDYGEIFIGNGAAFVDQAHVYHGTKVVTKHQITNILVSVYGDKAVSISDGRITLINKNEDGWYVWDAYGRYSDDWVYQDGEWLISRRKYRRDFALITKPENIVLGHSPLDR
ncbi:MAG: nuclear transport factor 2 family protein [Microbacteriaceae bacterium]|nr:nuclear transport factor 2 family protein [Microbacteriaceae bacterium]